MTVAQDTIFEALKNIQAPNGTASLVEVGAVRQIDEDDGTVRILLALPASLCPDPKALKQTVAEKIEKISGVSSCEIDLHVLSHELPMEGEAPDFPWSGKIPAVRNVIAVASGKGGVGKSTIAANFALALADLGHRVGLLDADIYGPSQQMMMGTTEQPSANSEGKILPFEVRGGVKVMSFGCIIDADQPVIWRGPMLMKALEQFFGDVEWGELDYLILDLPPGTGDVALTLCQNVKLAGVLIVTTPQDIALIDARKGLRMFQKLNVPVLGIVENMAFYECPSCGHRDHVFGKDGGRRTAAELELELLGTVPLDPAVVSGGDSGKPVVIDRPDSAPARAISDLAEKVVNLVDPTR